MTEEQMVKYAEAMSQGRYFDGLEIMLGETEQATYVVDRDEEGNVISVTQVVDPGPLTIDNDEYLRQLYEIQSIVRAMHRPIDDESGEE